MRKLSINIILFAVALSSLNACNQYLYFPSINNLTAGEFPMMDMTSFKNSNIKAESDFCYSSSFFKYQIIRTLVAKDFGGQSNDAVDRILFYLINTPDTLLRIDSVLQGFNFQFMNYMPVSNPKIEKPTFYLMKLNLPSLYIDTVNQKVVFWPDSFKYKSNYFPNKFVYPYDVITTYSQDPKLTQIVYYLIMDLPIALRLKTHFTEDAKQWVRGDVAIPNANEFGWIRLNKNSELLLLNPAITKTYKSSITLLWSLYLFNIKYDLLKDTCNCHLRPTYLDHCPLNLLSQNVQTYLEKAIDKDPEMYKSYFELIFWQMYQPKDFRIKDNNGEKRSFTFTSTSERFPGKYKVKFNIYRPYKFKVVRQ